jgi:NAD(P)-dependent dehydrogenase (short-subunit alcohol dehydrogenase family)
MSKVWLITGSAAGLGRSIAEAVLSAGNRLVATARNPKELTALVERHGDKVRTVALDVTDPVAAQSAVQVALDAFGRLDVLVNNAGFAHIGAFEQQDAADFRAQVETNFFGVVNMTRAALAPMHQQRSGHIIQVSSVGGRTATPGLTAYQSAKWAVGGFTEVLAQEVGPLGIKVTALEPGGMRTNWANRAGQDLLELDPDYAASVGMVLNMLQQYAGKEIGDPARIAEVVLRLAEHAAPPAHLLLGSDAVHFAGEADAAREANGKLWRAVSLATDFTAPAPIPAFPQPDSHGAGSEWTIERVNAATGAARS